jgi:predicted O-methyltransferase YrrM
VAADLPRAGSVPQTAGMDDPIWMRVQEYWSGRLLAPDPVLDATFEANAAAGLPPIDVSPPEGKLLHLLARSVGARRILEIGTLGGYSTIWLARALPPDGRLITCELRPEHAEVAMANVDRAGLAGVVDVRVGPAESTLAGLTGAFDLVFIDADKQSNVVYVNEALRLSRSGTVIIVDNVVRGGAVVDPGQRDGGVLGTRALADALAGDPRLDATVIQTVGSKGYDGFLYALVR